MQAFFLIFSLLQDHEMKQTETKIYHHLETFHFIKYLTCTCLLKVRDMEKENFGNLKTEPKAQGNE